MGAPRLAGDGHLDVVGLMRAYANVLGPYEIRCNTVHPTGMNTPMAANPEFFGFAEAQPALMDALHNALPVPIIPRGSGGGER